MPHEQLNLDFGQAVENNNPIEKEDEFLVMLEKEGANMKITSVLIDYLREQFKMSNCDLRQLIRHAENTEYKIYGFEFNELLSRYYGEQVGIPNGKKNSNTEEFRDGLRFINKLVGLPIDLKILSENEDWIKANHQYTSNEDVTEERETHKQLSFGEKKRSNQPSPSTKNLISGVEKSQPPEQD